MVYYNLALSYFGYFICFMASLPDAFMVISVLDAY